MTTIEQESQTPDAILSGEMMCHLGRLTTQEAPSVDAHTALANIPTDLSQEEIRLMAIHVGERHASPPAYGYRQSIAVLGRLSTEPDRRDLTTARNAAELLRNNSGSFVGKAISRAEAWRIDYRIQHPKKGKSTTMVMKPGE